ncbi:hypothetical protein BDK51DRAFT_47996 [Blyttiomyces helicus]|uniref:Uncharacterized protein n=1 Tax=Blyttiomyces helicus TaxID=388810 RepID=A0A4P9W2P7_9FUNG|nr:hypothetical protein BDK51DRAFT_47996 [Blyttiomyces helicus]|eukprot:RKO85453.1 hypothetical protein BDK51DRAFT_47996 [Blyttiomyces helicus]
MTIPPSKSIDFSSLPSAPLGCPGIIIHGLLDGQFVPNLVDNSLDNHVHPRCIKTTRTPHPLHINLGTHGKTSTTTMLHRVASPSGIQPPATPSCSPPFPLFSAPSIQHTSMLDLHFAKYIKSSNTIWLDVHPGPKSRLKTDLIDHRHLPGESAVRCWCSHLAQQDAFSVHFNLICASSAGSEPAKGTKIMKANWFRKAWAKGRFDWTVIITSEEHQHINTLMPLKPQDI